MNAYTTQIKQDIEAYLLKHEQKDMLRFITCGSVDDGKSTLIGRLLHDSKTVYEDQLAAIEKDSKTVGTTDEKIDLALLVDGLQSEREQGITIDVAYRYFSTDRRKFIIADTPGHEQYTRNMATGASSADLAILLIDARYGVQAQTRRHSYICSLLGIRNFVVAINKMDLVDYSQHVFDSIKADFNQLAEQLTDVETHFVPLSALAGDNVVNVSEKTPWYKGDTLMETLETVDITPTQHAEAVRFPVQYVNRPNPDFRGYCGTLASGTIIPGQQIKVLPSGKTGAVERILRGDQAVSSANCDEAITIILRDEIDISRGDLIVGADEAVQVGNTFEADIVWMHETTLIPDQRYDFKIGTAYVDGTISQIHSQVDINTLQREDADQLELNGIANVRIQLTQDIAYDLYRHNRSTGSFVIIDRLGNATVAAGMISQPVPDRTGKYENNDSNAQDQHIADAVTPQLRSAIKPHGSKCIWLKQTGLGSSLEHKLHQQGFHTYLLNTELFDANVVQALISALLDAGLIVLVEGGAAVLPAAEMITLDCDMLSQDAIEKVIAYCRV